jgi:hypothetical protein
MDASYSAWCRVDRGEMPDWYGRRVAAGAQRVERIAIPLARRIDRDAMGRQMVEECWWG